MRGTVAKRVRRVLDSLSALERKSGVVPSERALKRLWRATARHRRPALSRWFERKAKRAKELAS